MILIVPIVDFDQVKRSVQPTAYFAMNTCWWTDNPGHLGRMETGVGHGLPCGPRGEGLMTAPLREFLAAAKANPAHYGKHGLRAFMAAYHGNCLKEDATGARPWSLQTWVEYNAALDAMDGVEPGKDAGA
ncbi:hypothetical protein [Magnetospirillum sp. UT-4]|uniref:hypothetical protein n=1 Tax=Magnetospirillum sp. UT-4 TaxID=2681467 RepID=UPI00137DA340|nr:hypothetical protein [Magnetospirillum sp. UT-4]CAA7621097.1 hypothetical protein MTBUT4_380006 [Magnetospirillum sp. UT-4]